MSAASQVRALAALTLVLFATPVFAGGRALFDNYHAETAGNADWVIDDQQPVPSPVASGIGPLTAGTYWQGAISSFGVDLAKRGYTVATNTAALTYQNASNPNDLSNYDVLIVPEPNTSFSASEATAILGFVRDGGGLIAISDHSGSDRNNDGVDSPVIWNALDPSHLLGVHFGISTDSNNNIVQTSTNVNPSASDSVTHGNVGTVSGLAFHNGTTMTLYPGTNPSVRGEVWMTGVAQSSLTQVMAASSVYGNGRVFFIGDSSPVDDGSANAGNSSIYDGWGEAGATDSTLFLNATLWATRRAGTADTSPPTVAVLAPNGGEDWKAGSVHSVTWTASDDVGVSAIDLAYSVDGGASYPNTIASGLANSGAYAWTVPSAAGSALRVRATARDAAGHATADASDANFTISNWVIIASAGAGGGISPAGATAVLQGANLTCTMTPSTGYHVAGVLVDGVSAGAVTSYSFKNVTANHTIAASFAINTYTITASAGPNGSIAPAGAVTVAYGGSQAFAIAPAAGYHVADVLVDGSSVGAVTGYDFPNVIADHTIGASFGVESYPLAVAVTGSGTVARTPDQADYSYGASVVLTATPATGYHFDAWGGDAGGSANPLTVVVDTAHSIVAGFVPDAFPVTVLVSGAGSVQASPDLPLYDYATQLTLTPLPATGYRFAGWTGAVDPLADPLVLTIDGQKNLAAAFVPVIELLGPGGGEIFRSGDNCAITWAVSDSVRGASISVELSRHGADGPFETLASALPNTGQFSWIAGGPETDSAFVRVVVLDADGIAGSATSSAAFSIYGVLAAPAERVTAFALESIRPNPAPGRAVIRYALPVPARVRLGILDIQGREVARLEDGWMPAGRHETAWAPAAGRGSLPPGVYLVRLETPRGVLVRRLVLER